mmetsp:Transcript_52781/g.140878  ORF Transcript_52781/g.140878 Transcript_52781/m.140878 type:complete len:227 (-) Transcript_52781:176-856(-)
MEVLRSASPDWLRRWRRRQRELEGWRVWKCRWRWRRVKIRVALKVPWHGRPRQRAGLHLPRREDGWVHDEVGIGSVLLRQIPSLVREAAPLLPISPRVDGKRQEQREGYTHNRHDCAPVPFFDNFRLGTYFVRAQPEIDVGHLVVARQRKRVRRCAVRTVGTCGTQRADQVAGEAILLVEPLLAHTEAHSVGARHRCTLSRTLNTRSLRADTALVRVRWTRHARTA